MNIDEKKLKESVKLFLEAIGENPDREGLKETPDRIVRLWKEFKSHENFNMTVFEDIGSYDEMVVVRDIQFYSLCEHHLLPFFGKAHVAYIPDGKVCGLSKLVRVVNKFSYRPQVQERLTAEIAEYLEKELNPKGVAVVLEAEHLCYSSDTEILTDKGWKYFKDLDIEDMVAQVNPNTLEISFTKPVNYIKYPFKGMMINFKSKSVDLLVSPDHKMLYSTEWIFYKSKNKRWISKKAHEIKDIPKIIIPQAGRMRGKELEYVEIEEDYDKVYFGNVITKTKKKVRIKADIFIKFLGIYLSEGSYYIKDKKQYKVYIVQKINTSSAKEIEKVIKELPFNYSIYKRKNGTIEYVINSKVLTKYVEKFGKSADKYIPEFIYSLSERQKKLFLDYFILGDGYLKPDGKTYHFVSKSKKLIDGIQALYSTLGISSTVYEHKYKNGKVYYRLETRKDKNGKYKYYSMVRNVRDVPYNDYIYSVTVPEGYILVRRNNKIAISGNCMSMRGVKNPSSYTVTSKLTGIFKEDEKTRNEFFSLINSPRSI
jgi:GTP cyclohydrolase I